MQACFAKNTDKKNHVNESTKKTSRNFSCTFMHENCKCSNLKNNIRH